MAKKKKSPKTRGGKAKLYTLTEVSKATGISMPTLQRYKKLYQDRLPTVGEGRTQKYPEEALSVFQQIKAENMARRGRPKKAATAKAGKPKPKAKSKSKSKAKAKSKSKASAKQPAKAEPGLLSLAEIQRVTGISYPTLVRYVKLNVAKIPHVGEGRTRRYMPDAVVVFEEMRSQSKRGRKRVQAAGKRAVASGRSAAGAAGAAISKDMAQRIGRLEKAQAQISKQLKALLDEIKRPIEVTIKRS